MNRTDESIMVALQDRADGGVHVEDLLAGALQRGQRRRLVRRTLAGSAAGVLAVAVIGAVAVFPRGGPADVAPAADPPPVSPAGRPPLADGAPALGEGGTAGQNGLFHLDHEGTTNATWRSGAGWELMQTSGSSVVHTAIGDSTANLDKALAATGMELTPNPTSTPLIVDGKAATLVWSGMNPADGARWGYLRWQPVTGTWALVFTSFAADPGTNAATDRAKLLALTEQARFDQVYRCAVNFRLTWVPAATAITSCEFVGGAQPWARVHLSTGRATYSVNVTAAAATAAKPVNPNTDYSGTPLEYTDAGRVRRVAGAQVVTVDQGDVLLAKNDALHLAAAVQPVTATDPAGWPADPLH
ncbi:hypothetical protein [Paractinoplanes durhamensis]|uniref:hypothetical protein n=1 Tax=Paractinoplanes durhamensis TaxID=113563 RepID=UPI0031DE98B6